MAKLCTERRLSLGRWTDYFVGFCILQRLCPVSVNFYISQEGAKRRSSWRQRRHRKRRTQMQKLGTYTESCGTAEESLIGLLCKINSARRACCGHSTLLACAYPAVWRNSLYRRNDCQWRPSAQSVHRFAAQRSLEQRMLSSMSCFAVVLRCTTRGAACSPVDRHTVHSFRQTCGQRGLLT
jgi:hypothetical protein